MNTVKLGMPWAFGCLLLTGWAHGAEIEEIVVTAEKRESTLQETPIAVTAVTRDDIELRNLDDFSQIQFVAPGLVFSEIADMAQMTMRGVGVDQSDVSAEPGVALYSDSAYRGTLVSAANLLFDLERVEVLRGPQGTPFGRNSTGGALNVITRLPGEEAAMEANFIYGSYDRTRVEVSGDVPIVPGILALRGAVARDARDGYADNNFTGREEDDASATFAKMAAVFSPSDALSVVLRGEYNDSEIGGPPFIKTDDHPVPPLLTSSANPGGVLTIPGTFCGPVSCADLLGLSLSPGGVGSDDPRETYADGETQFDRESYGVNLTIEYDLNDAVTARSITSYFEIEQFGNQEENDGTEIPYLTDDFIQENKEWSQELTLSGATDKLDWILGGYHYESDIFAHFNFTLPALQPTYEALFGLLGGGGPLPPGTLAFFGPRIDGSLDPVPFLEFQGDGETKSNAVFAQGTLAITERLRGTAGVRWTEDKKWLLLSVANNLGGDGCRDLLMKDKWSETTWKAGLDADLGENTLLFGSVSTGFKAGGNNGGTCGNTYEPETLLAYEVGTKSRLLENRLQLNFTAFYYDYEDLQARLFVNNASIVENATNAETYGVEVEWLWLAGEAVRIDGSVSYLRTKFEDFLSTDPLNPHIGINCDSTGLGCQQDLSGNELLRSPEWKANLSIEYDIPLSGDAGAVTLRGEYAYTDGMYHTVFNNDFARQDGYNLVNARVIWSPQGGMEGIRIIGFVENIADDEYVMIHAPNATTGGTLSQYGPPRTWGIQVRFGQ